MIESQASGPHSIIKCSVCKHSETFITTDGAPLNWGYPAGGKFHLCPDHHQLFSTYLAAQYIAKPQGEDMENPIAITSEVVHFSPRK